MSRSADYTIQGFLYQFNQTLCELLKAESDDLITIEGIVEDIEIATFSGKKAIQCKYHETKEKYTPSVLYHPLLQMMKHYKSNPTSKIQYLLYVHLPNDPTVDVTADVLNDALNSKNKNLKILIAETKGVDVDGFLNVFEPIVTPKFDDLVEQNTVQLVSHGFHKTEVDTLFYPNSIQIIADLSIKHDPKQRTIRKSDFIHTLLQIKSTAVSHWTLALKTRQKILEARRKQLKGVLSTNTRLRHIAIFPRFLDNFDDNVVLFIKSYIDKYHFKISHNKTPLFALDVSQDDLDRIAQRLIEKNIIPNHGRPVNHFSEDYFFREPLIQKHRREFALRIIRWNDYKLLGHKTSPDDLFVIGSGDCPGINARDINVEVLGAENFDEIEYVMGISNAY